jgi:hypothetical protein
MDTAPRPGDRADTRCPETETERQRRIAWKAEPVACARASIAAGYDAASADGRACRPAARLRKTN